MDPSLDSATKTATTKAIGTVVGIFLGCLLIVIAIILVARYFYLRKKFQKQNSGNNYEMTAAMLTDSDEESIWSKSDFHENVDIK